MPSPGVSGFVAGSRVLLFCVSACVGVGVGVGVVCDVVAGVGT